MELWAFSTLFDEEYSPCISTYRKHLPQIIVHKTFKEDLFSVTLSKLKINTSFKLINKEEEAEEKWSLVSS